MTGKTVSAARVLSGKDILAANDIRRKKIEVEEWGGDVWVRGMTGVEFGIWSETLRNKEIDETLSLGIETVVQICIWSCVDEDGDQLFEDTPETREKLQLRNYGALSQIVATCFGLSGLKGSAEGN